jgi:hypothetical protein
MLQVNHAQLAKLQKIKDFFYSKTKVPEENNWKSKSDNELWLEIIGQIVVVGNSKPYEKLMSPELKRCIAYENLLNISDLENLKATINHVLLAIGARYASTDLAKSTKARAIARNLS